MRIVELILDEEQEDAGIEAISIVESPAIESDFVALNSEEIKLAEIDKDKKILLVVELKKGRVSDSVVGQIQRYMGYVKEDLAEPHQEVKGVIIGFDDDIKIHRALSVTNNIEFYKYKVDFKLYK